jgi:hypothetical protein
MEGFRTRHAAEPGLEITGYRGARHICAHMTSGFTLEPFAAGSCGRDDADSLQPSAEDCTHPLQHRATS